MSFEKRFLFSLIFSYLGIHVIALMIYAGGTNTRNNYVWQAISSLLTAEVFILKTALSVLAIGFVVVIITVVYEILTKNRKNDETRNSHPLLDEPLAIKAEPVRQEFVQCQDDSQKIKPQIISPDPPEVAPEPSPPTAEMMKESAIEEILRGY